MRLDIALSKEEVEEAITLWLLEEGVISTSGNHKREFTWLAEGSGNHVIVSTKEDI